MQITQDSFVSFFYEIKGPSGEYIDMGEESYSYIHGQGMIIEGLEKALEGREAREQFDITLEPGQAFGIWDPDLIVEIPAKDFPGEPYLDMEMTLLIDSIPRTLRVYSFTDDEVTLDGNHSLAGLTLTFGVKILEVRPATEEELDWGKRGILSPRGCGDCEGCSGHGGCERFD